MSLQVVRRALLPVAIAALPLVLLWSALRTFREIDEQRVVYLRDRVALLAARLESVPDAGLETLSEEEPYLADVQVIAPGSPADTPVLAPLWDGRELFRTESTGGLFRAYVPFHSGGELRLARIDLDARAADFLLVHARHNVMVASVSGLALLLLSIYALWAMRRQLQMEHLARIGKMAAALAHEIRNPLGTIKGYVQLAEERTEAPARALLAPALAEMRRLEALVNDLLAYGRPPHPEPKPTRWSEVAQALTAHARQAIGERPIRLVVSEAPLEWRTDAALAGQALLNLVRNAVEAIPGEGEVRIEARRNGAAVSVSVSDTGPGISEEALKRLGEPFFTTKAFGTGLGLAITRRIAESLGGGLELRRRAEGGTEAVLRMAG